MEMVVDRFAPNMGSGPYATLLNNLGGATPLEMSVLTEELTRSRIGGQILWLIDPAQLMTSLDMKGFSVSLLPVGSLEESTLNAPVAPWAWLGCLAVEKPQVLPIPEGIEPVIPKASKDPKTRSLIEQCCKVLIAAETDLNNLDAKSGVGDTGSTLATAANALIDALNRLPLVDLTLLFRSLGQEISKTMGGSSGVLLAIFFSAAGEAHAKNQNTVDSLKAGLDRIQKVGGARPGDRTMIDALYPALESLSMGMESAAEAARNGADQTANITKARAGRASYVSEKNLLGHNDPGAEAVARLFEHLARDEK